MPNNRRHTRPAQPETPAQNDPAVTPEQTPGPVEGTELEQGGGHEEQTAAEGQNAGEDHTQAEEGQTASKAPMASGLPMSVRLHTGAPVEDMVATADVTLGGICTIRNVKIKEDDYGLKVVMPRTKMPDTGRFKDACYFHTAELREQFDAAVKEAYRQTLEPAQEQGGMDGMTM